MVDSQTHERGFLGNFLVFLLFLVLTGQPASSRSSVILDLETQPSIPTTFQPPSHQNQITRLIVKVKDAATGSLVRNAKLDLRLAHLDAGPFFSTGFPWVEGKIQFHLQNLPAPDGTYSLDYMFPIRGSYRLEAKAETLLGEGGNNFDIHVKEQPFEVRNAWILCTLLFTAGFASAFLLSRWNRGMS